MCDASDLVVTLGFIGIHLRVSAWAPRQETDKHYGARQHQALDWRKS